MVPTIEVNRAEYKENKGILKMLQETKEWKFSKEVTCYSVQNKLNYS